MEKKNKFEFVMMGVFATVAVACAVCLIIFANQLFMFGSIPSRVWGIILLAVGFVVSITMFTILFTTHNFNKNKPEIKYEEVKNPEQENIEQQETPEIKTEE
ncbi:MAG: hypothetical protein J6Q51_03410 [Clostridia bacterium]|nr:hypothetical protein [Clostridia bacterium]